MFRSRSATTIFKAAGAGLLTAILCSCTGAASSKNKIAQILQQYHRNNKFSGAALVAYGDTVVYEGAFRLVPCIPPCEISGDGAENSLLGECWVKKRPTRYLRSGRLATHSAGTWDELIRRNFARFSRATMTHSRRLNAPTCCLPHTRVTFPASTAA